MTSLQVELLEPGCTPLRWCFGAWSDVLLVGLLVLRQCPLLGHDPHKVTLRVIGVPRVLAVGVLSRNVFLGGLLLI